MVIRDCPIPEPGCPGSILLPAKGHCFQDSSRARNWTQSSHGYGKGAPDWIRVSFSRLLSSLPEAAGLVPQKGQWCSERESVPDNALSDERLFLLHAFSFMPTTEEIRLHDWAKNITHGCPGMHHHPPTKAEKDGLGTL